MEEMRPHEGGEDEMIEMVAAEGGEDEIEECAEEGEAEQAENNE